MKLRPYQLSAVDALRLALAGGAQRLMLYSPTGSGKTEMALAIIKGAQAKGKRAIFLANRIHLVEQASRRFYASGIEHGIIQADNTRDTHQPVLVGSIDTVARRGFPALVALVTGPDGKGVTLHRTYLQDGRKAPVPSSKKLMPGRSIKGAAIRLHPAGDVLGIAEGIETALAAQQRFGVPVWSCVSAVGIESFIPPQEVRKVIIFGDNDESGTGQAVAWALAKRLIAAGLAVEVKLPERIGTDWADEVTA